MNVFYGVFVRCIIPMINKDDLPLIHRTFDCSCYSMLHSVRITHFPPQSWDSTGRFETIISMILTDQDSFWTRLKISWNYLTKRVPEVAEHIIVERSQIDEIIEFLDKFPRLERRDSALTDLPF